MIISLELDYHTSTTSLPVEICVAGVTKIIDLSKSMPSIDLIFHLDLAVQNVHLDLRCKHQEIRDFPLTLNNIVLDDFYSSKNIIHRGKPMPDDVHMRWVRANNLYFDEATNDSNRLDFTGVLRYNFVWPFFNNIFR